MSMLRGGSVAALPSPPELGTASAAPAAMPGELLRADAAMVMAPADGGAPGLASAAGAPGASSSSRSSLSIAYWSKNPFSSSLSSSSKVARGAASGRGGGGRLLWQVGEKRKDERAWDFCKQHVAHANSAQLGLCVRMDPRKHELHAACMHVATMRPVYPCVADGVQACAPKGQAPPAAIAHPAGRAATTAAGTPASSPNGRAASGPVQTRSAPRSGGTADCHQHGRAQRACRNATHTRCTAGSARAARRTTDCARTQSAKPEGHPSHRPPP